MEYPESNLNLADSEDYARDYEAWHEWINQDTPPPEPAE